MDVKLYDEFREEVRRERKTNIIIEVMRELGWKREDFSTRTSQEFSKTEMV